MIATRRSPTTRILDARRVPDAAAKGSIKTSRSRRPTGPDYGGARAPSSHRSSRRSSRSGTNLTSPSACSAPGELEVDVLDGRGRGRRDRTPVRGVDEPVSLGGDDQLRDRQRRRRSRRPGACAPTASSTSRESRGTRTAWRSRTWRIAPAFHGLGRSARRSSGEEIITSARQGRSGRRGERMRGDRSAEREAEHREALVEPSRARELVDDGDEVAVLRRPEPVAAAAVAVAAEVERRDVVAEAPEVLREVEVLAGQPDAPEAGREHDQLPRRAGATACTRSRRRRAPERAPWRTSGRIGLSRRHRVSLRAAGRTRRRPLRGARRPPGSG